MDKRTSVAIGLALFALTLLVYAGVGANGFVSYDDHTYVARNPHVANGLGASALGWALTSTSYACNWHPLTWISHMVDVSAFGLEPAGHHWHSVLAHASTAVLVFLFFASTTKAVWRSALVAALFALHPLRVESVAWVSERKDVLSGFLGMASLLVYARWACRGARGVPVAALVLFAASLLAKPTLVTLPALLLLVDRWPLERKASWRALALEKLPFLALALASCAMTLVSQSDGGCTRYIEEGVALGARLQNAVIAYATYLGQSVLPTGLSVFYPHPAVVDPGSSRVVPFVLAALALLAVGAGLFALRRRTVAPWIGWLWFLGVLLPMIGIVQVGGQSHADRYTYVPSIGAYVAVVWSVATLTEARPTARRAAAGLALASLAAFAVLSFRQVGVWRDTRTLFEHANATTESNYVAHTSLGLLEVTRGEPGYPAAREHFEAAVDAAPRFYEARYNLGWLLNLTGDPEGGLEHLRVAASIRPDAPEVHAKLGIVLGNLKRWDESEAELLEARRLDPDAQVDAALEFVRARRTGGE